MKRKIRLTEGDLHRIVKESVKRILRETENTDSIYSDEDFDEYGNRVDGPDFGDDFRERFWRKFEKQHGY